MAYDHDNHLASCFTGHSYRRGHLHGRAAGETAPIIFTAAVSVGAPISLFDAHTQPTPALPWNIYNLCTEHEAVDEIRHVQYGMVFTLVAIVLFLNLIAIIMRARISKKLRG